MYKMSWCNLRCRKALNCHRGLPTTPHLRWLLLLALACAHPPSTWSFLSFCPLLPLEGTPFLNMCGTSHDMRFLRREWGSVIHLCGNAHLIAGTHGIKHTGKTCYLSPRQLPSQSRRHFVDTQRKACTRKAGVLSVSWEDALEGRDFEGPRDTVDDKTQDLLVDEDLREKTGWTEGETFLFSYGAQLAASTYIRRYFP